MIVRVSLIWKKKNKRLRLWKVIDRKYKRKKITRTIRLGHQVTLLHIGWLDWVLNTATPLHTTLYTTAATRAHQHTHDI
jgi:hypothetical protein